MRAIKLYLKLIWSLNLLIIIQSSEKFVVDNSNLTTITKNVYNSFYKLRTLPFEDCGSLYDIIYLKISSCASLPCEMFRGTNALVTVYFDDNGNDTEFLKHRVRWVFNAVKTDAMITPDPCDGHDECIITVNDGKSYWAKVFVNEKLPIVLLLPVEHRAANDILLIYFYITFLAKKKISVGSDHPLNLWNSNTPQEVTGLKKNKNVVLTNNFRNYN